MLDNMHSRILLDKVYILHVTYYHLVECRTCSSHWRQKSNFRCHRRYSGDKTEQILTMYGVSENLSRDTRTSIFACKWMISSSNRWWQTQNPIYFDPCCWPTIWSFVIIKKGSTCTSPWYNTCFHIFLYYFEHNRSMRHILKLVHRCCINISVTVTIWLQTENFSRIFTIHQHCIFCNYIKIYIVCQGVAILFSISIYNFILKKTFKTLFLYTCSQNVFWQNLLFI